MSFKRIELPDEQCPKCGLKYEVVQVNLPVKDKDSRDCKCGHELRSWKETAHYEYTLVGE